MQGGGVREKLLAALVNSFLGLCLNRNKILTDWFAILVVQSSKINAVYTS